tara:strand:+ start:3984 stop:5102 length:1119 start_codon:yes stop_codon:yes gene_type:complete
VILGISLNRANLTHMKEFLIDHIDPLGQGVFKESDEIYFIPKTLPGEKGTFEVLKSKKGVHFGALHSLTHQSQIRIEPECPFYSQCSGCHYQHTSKEEELNFKQNNLKRLLKKVDTQKASWINLISKKRYHYRNRLQLHYNKKLKIIGFHQRNSHKITPITNCILAVPEIQNKIQKLTKNNHWLNIIPAQEPVKGHLELYLINNDVQLTWNQAYAASGFSQVNQEVNEQLIQTIEDLFSQRNLKILDLFGGSGNLTRKIQSARCLSIDTHPQADYTLDLFKDDSLDSFIQKHQDPFDTFIVDPPRSGFKNLSKWVEHFQPQKILYVSCNPATMLRDISPEIQDYQLEAIYFIDFFPGTYHYEAAVLLNRRVN